MSKCAGGCQNLSEEKVSKTDKTAIDSVIFPSVQPWDPNEIIGLDGYNAPGSTDTLRWVSATQTLSYTVYFENDAELAMAAASKVTVNVPLHEKLNFATFGVGNFGFGSHTIVVEGSPSSYQTRIDLRDSMGIYLDVVAGLDIVHNEAFWIFQSIDPATGLPPTDIHLGFLPINDSLHSGEGFVTCTIKPKAGECVTGDTVSATASIVFDVNEAIPTNTWVNTIDAFAPTSTLTMTPNAAGDMLTATFAGEDDEGGCGVKQYKLYYSVNGSAYQLYDVYPAGDTAQIQVETGMEYEFFTLAEDNVGNCESMKTQPEYNIGTNFVTLAVNAFPQEAGTVSGGGTYTVNDTAQLSATAAEGYHFVNWMNQGVPVSMQNPYSAVVSQNQTYTAYFERNAYTLQTIADMGSFITVTDLNGNEVPSGSTVLHFDKLIVTTDSVKCYTISGLWLNGAACVSGDTLTVTGDIELSTTTEPLMTQTDTTAIACDSFVWYGETLTETGDYTKTFTSTVGCDSVVTLHLTLKHSEMAEYAETACDSYTWNDSVYTQSGDYVQTFTNADGCDSVVTLHLTVNNSNTGDTTAIACNSFDWYGTTYTVSGEYPHTLTNVSGCDSVVTLNLTVNYPVAELVEATACDSYTWNTTTYTQSGDYTQTFTAANGCDSVVTLHLTVNNSNTGDTTAIACDSFNWYGTTYTSSGNYMHTLTNANGCDSVVTLHLTVNHPVAELVEATTCDSYIWNDSVYTQSGDYTQTFTAANGCDSVVTLHLTVNHPVAELVEATACDSYSWNDSVYTQSGDYTQTFTAANGCDSIVTLHLTVNHSTTGDTTAVVCGSFNWYGTTCISSGNYMHTLTNAAGCDSIVTLHLTVNHSNTGDTTAVVCDSFIWYGITCISSGNYMHTLTNAAGCDSVVTLHLTVNHSVTELVEATACDSYSWNGTTYTQSGDYTQTFTAANGCDSVVTLHLTVNHSVAELVEVTACGSYVWNNSVYTQSGDYTQTLTTANGCDSVVTLHLTVNHGTYTETTVDTCGIQYYWALADTTVTQSGTYYYYSTNTNTCADTAVLILSLYQPAATEISAQICAGEVYNQNGFNVSTAGDYQLNLQTIHGCDSTVILHLTVGSETVTYLTASICEGDNYNDNGFVVLAPTVGTQVYSDTIARPGACDSVVLLTLTVNAVTSGDTTAVVNSSFDWYGQHLTTTGDYTHTLTNAAGCDSVVTLHLTINYTNTGDTTAVACDSFDWYEHTNLTQSGDYIHVFTNAAGGDSVVTLHLTVLHSVAELVEATSCDNYTWNGTTYTQSGDYTQTFTAANGCDSVVTLHLTLLEIPVLQAITGEPEICINQYAIYHYDISDPNYQYRWLKDNVLWAENVPVLTLHEMSEGMVLVTMQVADEQSGCAADTSLSVQVVNRIAPDTTEIRRKGNTNILICQPVYSDYGQVHYRWGYTDLNTTAEVVMPGDRNYCLYDFGIDTLSYRYWVETYLNEAVGAGCENRSYYAYGYITTSTPDYGGNIVEAYLSNSRIVLYVSSLSPDDIKASLYDVNGKLLVSKGYGVTDQVSDMIPVSIAPGVYFLRVSIGGQLYSIKLLKI